MKGKEQADKYFNEIMQLQGVDELKNEIQRLQKFQQNKEKYSVSDAVIPNYLWIAKRGGGLTTCLNAFSEFLYASKIIEFTGIVKYLEFNPFYTAPNIYFSELARLNNSITEIAGHNRHFKGVVCIIIDEWLDSTNEVNFNRILDYLDNINDKILAIFCAHTDNERTIKNIEASIKSYMRSTTITLRFPNIDELVKYIESKYLNKSNFFFSDNAKLLLTESINEIIGSDFFNGFKTINQLADDIIYSLLTSDIHNYEITDNMLRNFDKNSAYIKRIKTSGGRTIIGFGQKEV